MDKLLEFVAPIIPNVFALLCPNLEEKTETLRRKIRFLKRRRDDIDVELRSHSGKKRKGVVEDWMDDVENIIKDVETSEQQSSRFYHVFKRQKLAEQLESMTAKATELVGAQGEFSNGLFLEVDESIDRLLLKPQPNDQAFQQNSVEILKSLMDVEVTSIGIYGMGGVGKTTLAKCVHDKLKLKESIFSDHVYWVTVSQEFSISKLQSDIAGALNPHFSFGSDETKRAAQLFQEFEKIERFVLILDDVWERIDAEKIGIPLKRNGCKLVVTSRSEKVCQGMYCQKIIKVNTLSEQEALDLFWKTLDHHKLSEEVEEICEKMVNRCGGLPLALITLAGSMRGVTDIHEWRDASEGLKGSRLRQADMEDGVFPILLYSYHRLRDPRLKRCFLHCSLYPEDCHLFREELIRNFVSEELMERGLSWQAEVDQGHAILNQLVRTCLLESDSNGYVKMHDLIRDMAIRITKDNPRYMVKAGLHLNELPEEQEWTEDLDKVSLMDNYIEEISLGTSPKCPSLSTLILRGNPLRLIPECFFKHMCGLRTLNLSFTKIKSLPDSISDLEKLNALLLTYCSNLVSVPPLEKLKVLRHLGLSGTIIEEVPQGMESLTNLKRMSLICDKLKKIPTGTLHGLTQLQQLELPNHLVAPIEEVEALKQLEVIQVRLNSVRDLNRFINSRQIDKQLHFYKIELDSRESIPQADRTFPEIPELMDFSYPRKCLLFGNGSLMESSLDTDENMLPRDIENLFFSGSGLSGCLLDEFPSLNYARDLKRCSIDKEDKIECIMRSSTGVPFQSLESLQLYDLPNLIGLFKWEAVAPLPPGTFSSLKMLNIRSCDKIKKFFPQSLVRNFHNLRYLTVYWCYQMEEIIENDNNEGADITLPMLEDEQQSSSTGVPFQSLVTFELGSLPNLIGLFKWEAVAPLPPGTFSSLKSLSINRCDKIKKVFPQSLVHNFHNLQSLNVWGCNQMEEIIEDDNNEGADITLPMLKNLILVNLPQLKSICKGKMICDSIDRINLWGTKNIKELPLNLPLLHGQLSPPPCLKSISIEKELWESLEWADHNAKNVLQPLVSFEDPS